MIFLEMAMIVIGLGAVVYSFRASSVSDAGGGKNPASEEERQQESMRVQAVLDSFTEKAEDVCDQLEDRMSRMSNEKIMGINEYSDQVMDKIERNHNEVVFLYDMMNEKQEEVQRLVHSIDVQKAELHNEAAAEYQKMRNQEKLLDELRKQMELDFLQLQSEQERFRTEFGRLGDEFSRLGSRSADSIGETESADAGEEAVPGVSAWETKDMAGEEHLSDVYEFPGEAGGLPAAEDGGVDDVLDFDASVFDDEIARIEEAEGRPADNEPVQVDFSRGNSEGYTPLAQQEKMENHNDEILSLYKKGRSVLEISKMLSLGQGEVKFVIDLYNAG